MPDRYLLVTFIVADEGDPLKAFTEAIARIDLDEDGRPISFGDLTDRVSREIARRFGSSLGGHRGPEGPNEDTAVCPTCLAPSHEMRPDGETYGHHLPDCSLPRRHKSYCQPGGAGHAPAATIRGFWPETETGSTGATPGSAGEPHPCGDYPAPCNCDDPVRHNGH